MTTQVLNSGLKVLLIDDSPEDRFVLKRYLKQDPLFSYQVEETGLGNRGLEICLSSSPDLVFLDYRLPDISGLEFLEQLANLGKELICPIIVLTGINSERIATEFKKYEIQGYLAKDGLTPQQLHQVIHLSLLDYQRKIQARYYQHKQILESISDGFYAIDLDEHFTYINHKVEELWGVKGQELFGKKLLETFPVLEPTPFYAFASRVLREQIPVKFETYLPISQIWASVSMYPTGEGLAVYYQDLTERKQAEEQRLRWQEELEKRVEERTAELAAEIEERQRVEEELGKSRELYRSVLNAMSEGVMVQELDGTIIAANPSAEKILGRAETEILSKSSLDPDWQTVHDDGAPFPGETHPVMVTARTGQPCNGVIMGLRQAGDNLKWISINTQPLYRPDNLTLRGVVASFSDITEKRLAEQALKESEEQYRLLYDNSLYGVLLAVPNGRVLAANPRACQMLGYNEQEILALGRARILDRSQEQLELDHKLLYQFGGIKREMVFIHRDGTRIPCEDATSLYYDRSGEERLCIVIQDIRTRMRAEEALRESEERFRVAQENSPDHFMILRCRRDSQGQIEDFEEVYTNPAMAKARGFTVEELAGRSFPGKNPTVLQARIFELGKKLVENGEPFSQEFISERNGLKKWFWITGVKLGEGLAITSRDITGQKEAEAEIKRREQEFRTLAENSPDLILRIGLDMQVLYVNPAFARFTATTTEKLVGRSTPSTPNRTRIMDTLAALKQKVLETGLPQTAEIEFREDGGIKTYLQYRMVAELNSEGKPQSLLVIARDLTELKEAQEELINQARFQTLFELSPDGVALTNLEGQIINCNQALAAFAGLPREKLVGQLITILGKFDLKQMEPVITRALQEEEWPEPLSFELPVNPPGNAELTLEIKTQKVLLADQIHFLSTVRDITERKQLENELKLALEQQRELTEMKGRFISTTSHEFRTPLSVIQAVADTLDKYIERMTPEQIRERVDRIKRQVSHITKLLDDVLAYNRLQAKVQAYNPVPGDLAVFSRELLEELEELDKNQHTLRLHLPEEPFNVSFDRLLVKQVITNLVSNALKYSPAGTEVEFELKEEGGSIEIRVSDRGIGIPPKDQASIFEAFHRSGNVGTIQGTGLGLAILKESVSLIGGQIGFTSRESEGTTFTVNLPLRKQAQS